MKEIYYPTLDLFVYQLAGGLGANEQNITQNAATFLGNLPEEIKEKVENAIASSNRNGYVEFKELLPHPHYHPFPGKLVGEYQYPVDGFYYPARLFDTYSLLFDSSINPRDKAYPVSSFRVLKSETEKITGNLGKACILSGYLTTDADAEEIAKQTYKEFIASDNKSDREIELEWQKREHGTFLGANLFVIWPSSQNPENIPEISSVVIILYDHPVPSDSVIKQAADLNLTWMRLFCFQNKIIWAYAKSRQLKKQLESKFIDIVSTFQEIENLPVETKKTKIAIEKYQSILKKRAKTLSSYAIELSYIKIQHSTIDINLHNYKLCLQYLESEANKTENTDLKCFKKFIDIVTDEYQKQIEKDYASLSPGIEALENVVNSINSIVELEQGERDRNIEHLIAATGVGIGTASTIATAFTGVTEQINQFPHIKDLTKGSLRREAILDLGIIISFSLITGIFAAKGTLSFFKWVNKDKRSRL